MRAPVTSSSSPGEEPSSRSRSTSQRVALLDVNARDGQVGGALSICLIGFVALVLRDSASDMAFDGWIVAVSAAALLRTSISWAWRRGRTRSPMFGNDTTVIRWEWAYLISALFTGLAWASLTVVAGDVEQVALPVTLTLVVALILASASPAGSLRSQIAFTVPIVVAQEFHLVRLALAERGAHDWLAPIVWIAVVVVLFLVKRNASTAFRENLAASIEHERRASEQTALLQTAPLGVLVVRDLRIVICNDALLKILGYERKEELLGKSIRTLLPDDEAWKQAVKDGQAALRGPVPPRIVSRRRRDGSLIEIMHNVAAVHTGHGEPEFIGLYEDFTDRMATEEGFRHAVRMQRLVFESAGEGIAIVSDGLIEQANRALSDLVGVSVDQLKNRPLHSIFDDPLAWTGIEKRLRRLGSTLKIEHRVVRSDGRTIWTNVTGCLVDAAVGDAANDADPVAPIRSIWVFADLSAQKRKEAENWHHANHDVMTGLPNRRFLLDRLDQALASARRDGRRVAVVELDLDGFKSANDEHGHRFGDAVLEGVARRLSTVVRELDTVGRWGGDEFVLVLREIESLEVVEETVKRIIGHLSEPIVYRDRHMVVGASIGIALYPDHGDEVEVLMLAADLAMYESKANGGNTWRFATPVASAPRGKYRPAEAPLPDR